MALHTSLHFNSNIFKCHHTTVRILLQKNPDVDATTRAYGATALIMAAWYGHADIVEMLLQSNANVNAKDKNHRTALFYASEYGRTQVVRVLLQYNPDLNIKGKSVLTPDC